MPDNAQQINIQQPKPWNPVNTYFKATGLSPGYYPESMTGALPYTIIQTLLGGVGGRYLLAPILRRLYPEVDEDRINELSMYGGGLAGLVPGLATMGAHYSLGGARGLIGGWPKNVKPKTLSPEEVQEQSAQYDATKKLWGAVKDVEGIPQQEQAVKELGKQWEAGKWDPNKPTKLNFVKEESDKSAGLFDGLPVRQPSSTAWRTSSIPVGTTLNTLDTAVYSHQLDPVSAAMIGQSMIEAQGGSDRGMVAPNELARGLGTMLGTGISYGTANLGARIATAAVNALGANFTPGEQQLMAQGAGGANAAFYLMGKMLGGGR